MNVIELGGGAHPKLRPNVDCRSGLNVDFVMDFEKPLAFDSDQFDMVYSAYTLEHLSWRKVKGFVKEVYRILKPTGKAVIITANLLEQCKKVASAKEWNEEFSCLIFGGQDHEHNFHKCGFSLESAVHLFKEAGFKSVTVAPLKECATDMTIEAYKGIVDRRQWILNHCRKGEKILDVGSANGVLFRGSGFESQVTFLDIDRYDLPNFIQMDAHNLKSQEKSGFKNKSFDLVVLGEILEHGGVDPVKILKGAKRVGKRLLITVPDPVGWASANRPYETLEEAVKRTGKTAESLAIENNPYIKEFYKEDGYKHLFHFRWYTREMLEDHLKEAGIKNYVLDRLAYMGWSFFVVEAPKPKKEKVKEYLPLYKQYLLGEIQEGKQPLNT